MNDYSNALIYGKNSDLLRIVSVETTGDELVVFQELEDGSIEETRGPASHWFLTPKRVSESQTELAGNQYYKYLSDFSTLEEKNEKKKLMYQKRIDFYTMSDTKEANLTMHGMTYYKDMQLSDVSVLSFDIETDGLTKTNKSEIYIITNTFRNNNGISRRAFNLEDYNTETPQADMLQDWCNWVREMNPSLMIGHNIFGYDIPYIAHVAKLHGVALELGRDGSELRFNNYESSYRKDQTQSIEYYNAYIYGREIIDTMFLAIKYDVVKKEFPTYGLKPIIKQLGLEKADRSFVDAGKIRHYFNERLTNPEMWEKAKQYAEEDSDDALKLFDKMAPSYFYFTQSVSKPFQAMINGATGSQINNMMVRAYLQNGHSIAKADEVERFEGAISFGCPGIYRNAFKQDVASLYPSIMRQYKIYDSRKDPKKYFLQLVETFTLQRLAHKKLAKETGDANMDARQEGEKIGINSMYGFLGATGLNYNSPKLAALVTKYGREILEKAVVFATGNNVEYWKKKAGIISEEETAEEAT